MESLTPVLNNNNTAILTEQPSINNSTKACYGRNIQILNNDCIVIKILSYLNQIKDIIHYKRINKYSYSIIKETQVLEKLFFLKYCISPKNFFELPFDYLLSINNQLQSQTITIKNENSHTNKHSINIKKKLFFAIENNLAQAKSLSLKNIATIRHDKMSLCITFSKDNNFFAASSNDETAKIYQFTNGSWQQLYVINHENGIQKIIFSPDNRYIITFSKSTYLIWNLSPTKGCKLLDVRIHNNNAEIYFRNDSKRVFIKYDTSSIDIFDIIDNQWIRVFLLYDPDMQNFFNINQGLFIDDPCLPISIKNDKWLSFIIKRYAVSSMLNTSIDKKKSLVAELKDIVQGTKWLGILRNDRLKIKTITYSDDMRLIYGYCPANALSIILEYTNNQWQLKLTFNGGDDRIPYFSSDNQRIITKYSHFNNDIYQTIIWNINSNVAYKELVLANTSTANFSKDSKYIMAVDREQQITIWRFINGFWKIKTTVEQEHIIKDIFFSNYNWMIAVSCLHHSAIFEVINDCKNN